MSNELAVHPSTDNGESALHVDTVLFQSSQNQARQRKTMPQPSLGFSDEDTSLAPPSLGSQQTPRRLSQERMSQGSRAIAVSNEFISPPLPSNNSSPSDEHNSTKQETDTVNALLGEIVVKGELETSTNMSPMARFIMSDDRPKRTKKSHTRGSPGRLESKFAKKASDIKHHTSTTSVSSSSKSKPKFDLRSLNELDETIAKVERRYKSSRRSGRLVEEDSCSGDESFVHSIGTQDGHHIYTRHHHLIADLANTKSSKARGSKSVSSVRSSQSVTLPSKKARGRRRRRQKGQRGDSLERAISAIILEAALSQDLESQFLKSTSFEDESIHLTSTEFILQDLDRTNAIIECEVASLASGAASAASKPSFTSFGPAVTTVKPEPLPTIQSETCPTQDDDSIFAPTEVPVKRSGSFPHMTPSRKDTPPIDSSSPEAAFADFNDLNFLANEQFDSAEWPTEAMDNPTTPTVPPSPVQNAFGFESIALMDPAVLPPNEIADGDVDGDDDEGDYYFENQHEGEEELPDPNDLERLWLSAQENLPEALRAGVSPGEAAILSAQGIQFPLANPPPPPPTPRQDIHFPLANPPPPPPKPGQDIRFPLAHPPPPPPRPGQDIHFPLANPPPPPPGPPPMQNMAFRTITILPDEPKPILVQNSLLQGTIQDCSVASGSVAGSAVSNFSPIHQSSAGAMSPEPTKFLGASDDGGFEGEWMSFGDSSNNPFSSPPSKTNTSVIRSVEGDSDSVDSPSSIADFTHIRAWKTRETGWKSMEGHSPRRSSPGRRRKDSGRKLSKSERVMI